MEDLAEKKTDVLKIQEAKICRFAWIPKEPSSYYTPRLYKCMI